jgi:hypothetical protein
MQAAAARREIMLVCASVPIAQPGALALFRFCHI